jgi:hypothetical protein
VTSDLPVVTSRAEVGPQDPSAGTPLRAAGSRRRTTSVDITRPDGIPGPLRAEGRARDVVTGSGAELRVLARQSVVADLDLFQELLAIEATPPAALDRLVGARVAGGFRAKAADAVPDHRHAASLLYLLLDDLPAAALVSGYAMQRAGIIGAAPPEVFAPNADLCAGWAADATVFRIIHAHGTVPMTIGPAAPTLERDDDRDGWHELPEPTTHTVRRRRRIDVVDAADGLEVDAMFRDSYFDAGGAESVVHEYGLLATIDPETLVVTAADATPRVLPYVECPTAAASASRLVGFHLDEVRDRVRAEWTGPSTCTHLNDLLRSLEDVRALRWWDRSR